MQKRKDGQKLKQGQSATRLSTLLSSHVAFKFKTAYSIEECLFWLRKEETAPTAENKRQRIYEASRAVKISSNDDHDAHFQIQINRGPRFGSVKINGLLQGLEDGGTLVEGQISLRRPLAAMLFLGIWAVVGATVFQFWPAILVGCAFLIIILSMQNADKSDFQRYVSSVFGNKRKSKG